MAFLVISFFAGVLTVLAPCILPLLPVVIGSGAAGRSRLSPYIVVGSLAVSVLLFTFLLKVSTAFISIPPETWTYLSGTILLFFGLTLVFPALWERLPGIALLSAKSNKLVGSGYQKKSLWGDALIGVALGPVFTTCSPTYFVILASVLPASFLLGTTYLLAYIAGLSLVLLALALIGERFVQRLAGLSDPRGWFKRGIGIVFIILALLIITGYEKKLEKAILEGGFFDVTKLEQRLLQSAGHTGAGEGMRYVEIAGPSGFVNTDGITLGELVGKKVILVDFMTYSCINCQRTVPHVVEWYDKYRDEGLEIVAIHTPEFAFEKDIDNVRQAMKDFGVEYPVVLDNDYATWRAYGNQYWPRKYLIDINGTIVYDHIGEGDYEETEMKIKEALRERALILNEKVGPDTAAGIEGVEEEKKGTVGTPEIYFGSERNQYLGNGDAHASGSQSFTLPNAFMPNTLYLGGPWNIQPEYARAEGKGTIKLRYRAGKVFMVASAPNPVTITVVQDGVVIKTVTVQQEKLYTLIDDETSGEHLLELRIEGAGFSAYTFTFG